AGAGQHVCGREPSAAPGERRVVPGREPVVARELTLPGEAPLREAEPGRGGQRLELGEIDPTGAAEDGDLRPGRLDEVEQEIPRPGRSYYGGQGVSGVGREGDGERFPLRPIAPGASLGAPEPIASNRGRGRLRPACHQ